MAIPLLDEILTFIQSLISWFVQSSPPWMKILISFFLVVIAGNLITSILLGASFACTTGNTLYKIDSIVTAYNLINVRLSNEEIFRNSSINYSSVVTKPESDRSFLDWLNTYGKCFSIIQNTNWTECSLGPVWYDAYLHPDNFTQEVISQYDGMVLLSGTKYVPTQAIINPKCINNSPRLYLFGSVDIFDLKLWIAITLLVMIIPIAIKWYEINHIF